MAQSRRRRALLRKVAPLSYDVFASALAFCLALSLSFGHGLTLWDLPGPHVSRNYALIFAAIAGATAWFNGLHRGIWRYTSLLDFINILKTCTATVLIFLPIAFLTVRANLLPRQTIVIAWFLMMAFIGGPRFIQRVRADHRTPRPFTAIMVGNKLGADAVPILLAGNARRVEPFVRELRRVSDAPYVVVGILTAELDQSGQTMHGVPVLGTLDDISHAITYLNQRKIRPARLVIADDTADQESLSKYLEAATQYGLTLGRLPRLMDLESGRHSGAALIQPIALGDLLGRPQAVLNLDAMRRLVMDKRILVTGAGGSIGAELVRQVSDLGPSKIVFLDNTEFNLYSIEKELAERHPEINRQDALCDVRDRRLLDRWFAQERPEIVFHAAALKHVPLVESHPIEGIRTNVLGTQNVADACIQHDVSTMILISTDKAVNPHNIMGATKRSAEAYCQALDAEVGTTRFIAVRFGNVLGSAGSVVPLFQRQLAAGGPLTVTHPDVTRFFMTIPEAVALVLQASALGSRSDAKRGSVFVLDMGKSIKIADLARQLIRLSGRRPELDIAIEYIGLRPGEKLFEEIVHQEEELGESLAEGVMIVSSRTVALRILKNQFSELSKAVESYDEERALRLLKIIVPEYEYRPAQVDTALGR